MAGADKDTDVEEEEESSSASSAEKEPEERALAEASAEEDDDAGDEDPADAREEEPPKKRSSAKGEPRRKSAKAAPKSEASVPLASIAHLAFVVVAAIAVYSFVSVAKEGELRRRCSPTCLLRPNYAGYEKKAPSFTLKDTNGHDVSLESYRGKVVILNFWTKTCGPCMEEMPEIADLARILRSKKDVAVLTISTDESAQDAMDTLKSILREEPPFPVLMDPETTVVRDKFGTTLYPETWIIDKDGVIRARFDGAREWSNATVVELVDQIRSGGYCPAQAREGRFVGESARLCESLSGG